MAKRYTKLVLLIFLGAVSLQAYAQGCAMHCDLMPGAMDAAMVAPADSLPDDDAPCAQVMLCQAASSIPLAVLSAALASFIPTGVGSPETLAVTFLDDRALAPLDRPPILS